MPQLTFDTVRGDVADVLGEDASAIADDENLLELGLDSIRVMTLVERWRTAGAETNFLELAERPTLAEWWELLNGRQSRDTP
ncbi:bifunctional isochorismate lyase / aryl carrier protein [Sinosporangium album]|uniref:Bifunctional isochorismate lyase / aryl carrier protein n=1 Tax=Sinosporangium album TaxID=504805 RepID=A0A1G8HNE7_9ACTN|nr:phosphopantetheine-binding protein [Sinosporangium album]SDI08000.1 bifunctional isochorismate lyase / aryl carrier protein [Sinosporangium album]